MIQGVVMTVVKGVMKIELRYYSLTIINIFALFVFYGITKI